MRQPIPRTPAKDEQSARKARRVALESDGLGVGAPATFPGPKAKASEATQKRIGEVAKANGFSAVHQVYPVTGGANFKAASESR